MSKVCILSDEVIGKIAAGEVIERPASVVKELVENSLDAGSSSIEIHLEDAGKKLIAVKDNGSGIEPDDMEKIFLRHSTSKITSVDDIGRILSFGFRGEALYSIGIISDVTLKSKTGLAESGWEIHLRGGEKLSIRPTAMQNGTDVLVKELFFNTPARRKFLKTDATELNQILNTVIPYTLMFPNVRFHLRHGRKVLIDLPVEKDPAIRVSAALNLPRENLIETEKETYEDMISVRAILGNSNIRRPRRDHQYIFINGRPVSSQGISFAVNQAYRLLFPAETYPFFAIFLEVPAEIVDVNIHPTKREVKVRNESKVLSTVRMLCERYLMTPGKPRQLAAQPDVFQTQVKEDQTTVERLLISEPKATYVSAGEGKKGISESMPGAQEPDFRDSLSIAAFIGVFRRKYLLFEFGSSLFVVDQHAAHERIIFERLAEQMQKGQVEVQQLLIPMVIGLSVQEMVAWEDGQQHLEKAGFITTRWDKEAIALHAHPRLITDPELSLRNIFAGGSDLMRNQQAMARNACRQSIMAGENISKEEAERLRDNLLACNDPFICPHGRPTVVEIKESFLNRQFLR
jgi:DNA mismatch repair protein MutL